MSSRAGLCVLATLAVLFTNAVAAHASPLQEPAGVRAAAATGRDSAERAASAAAQSSGETVEVLSARGERQKVYALPDGSFRMEMSVGPARVRKGSGWVDPDPTLQRRDDGSIAPVASADPMVFSGGGTTPLVRLSRAERSIELTWPDTLPSPTLDGDTATYAEVLPGVDLELSAHTDGFSPVFLVKSREAADNPRLAQIEFGLAAQGLTVTPQTDGSLAAHDEAGQTVFASSRLEMSDAPPDDASRDATDEETAVGEHQAVGRVELVANRLRLIPDQGLLDNPAARYPVRIDPYWAAPQNAWAKVFKGKPDQAYWFGGLDGPEAKAGYCGYSGCNGIGETRSYFQFHTGALAGANVLRAEFNVRESWAPSCAATPLQIYRTNPIDAGMTWNRGQPGWGGGNPWLLWDAPVAFGYSGCPANWIGINVPTNAITAGGLTTFMLRARDEGVKTQWKKFDSFASRDFGPQLIVTYNWPPNQPWDMSASGGPGPNLGCAVEADRAFSYTGIPTLAVTLNDPDGDSVAAQFEWWNYGANAPVGSRQTTAQASGLSHQMRIPVNAFTDGARISWRVRAFDGVAWGPWSRFCQLTVDMRKPGRPTIVSGDYPEKAFGGFVGKTGAFDAKPARGDTDIIGYQWSLGSQDLPPVDVNSPYFVPATGGGARIWATPMRNGPIDLYVRAVDRALNVSDPYRTPDADGTIPPGGGYHFLVGTATVPPTAHFPLDGDNGAKPFNVAPDLLGGPAATINGVRPDPGASFTFGRTGDALRFTGSALGYAATAKRVSTDATFAVSAWVMLDSVDGNSYTAVSQDGSNISGFYLGYVGDEKRFAFRMAPSDSAQATVARARSSSAPLPNVWYHLVGVFERGPNQLRLYVNGQLQGSANVSGVWSSTGSFHIGRAKVGGAYGEPWRGHVDDVKVWNKALGTTEIQDLVNRAVVEEAFFPLDEGGGTRVDDVSGSYHIGTTAGGVTWRPGLVGPYAAQFDGADDAVVTTGQAVRTDGSFSVSAFARVDPDSTATVQTAVSQDGATSSAYALQYRDGQWVFRVDRMDGGAPMTARGSAPPSGWVHLVGTYDAVTGTVQIYVNTQPGTADTGRVRTHTPGPVVIGRAKEAGAATGFFDGAVDDVHVYTGVLDRNQIEQASFNAVPGRPNPYAGELARFVDHGGRHFIGNGPVPPGTLPETGLGVLAPPDAPGTNTLYSCRYNGGWYVAMTTTCEGANKVLLGVIGKLYAGAPSGRPLLPVYRCVIPATGDHYNTTREDCEDTEHVREGFQGNSLAYRNLVRYVSDLPGHDHLAAVSMSNMPVGYRPEYSQGLLAQSGEQGTVSLYTCVDDGDEFLSTSATCDGETVRRREGGIWTQPPTFAAASAPLYSCRMETGLDRFTSLDEFCEGEITVGSLGYIITRLY